MSEFGTVGEKIKLRFNVGKSKVVRCSSHVIVGQMNERLNGEPLEDVDSIKYPGTQKAADGGCGRDEVHRMKSMWNTEKCTQ